MSKRESSWAFFVDESGDFADPSDAVSVAGLLVNELTPSYRPSEMRKTLEAAAPGFPWPLHASFINQPAYVAIAAYQRDPSLLDKHQPGLGAIVREVIALCEARAAMDLDSATAAIKAGRKPPYDALHRLSGLVRRQLADAHERLVDVSREAWRAVHVLAERLIASRDGEGRPLAAFIAASETSCGDAVGANSVRYFSVLRVAIERAAALLERYHGRHRLLLNVQQRLVYDDRFKKAVMLTPQHLGPIIRELARFHRRVHLVAAETPDFGGTVGVEYVLADFLANRSRGVLDDRESPLATVEAHVGEYFGAPLRSEAPSRSHLAATGTAWTEVTRQTSSPVIEWHSPYKRVGA